MALSSTLFFLPPSASCHSSSLADCGTRLLKQVADNGRESASAVIVGNDAGDLPGRSSVLRSRKELRHEHNQGGAAEAVGAYDFSGARAPFSKNPRTFTWMWPNCE